MLKNSLENEPFSFKQFKNGNVSICWNGKEVLILKSHKAQKFISQIKSASVAEAQLIMAKITGNFKRGNEREAKRKNRR